ncbi:MAG TPA: hypothetical protein VGI57_11925, partial [Usitatibacter sp.]
MATTLDAVQGQNRSDSFPLAIALTGYGLAVFVSYLFRTPEAPEIWLTLVALSGAGTLFFVWRSIDWQGRQFDSFLAILLLASIANR